MSEQTEHTPSIKDNAPGEGRRLWRSLEDLAGAPEFEEARHREFPKNASEMTSPFSRRAFLGLMAASAALAGSLTGCRRPEVEALPYTKAPERQLPGVPTHYATSLERAGGQPIGVIVTCHQGRPIKIEGNPEHPASLGAVDPITQSLILELYDPERSKTVLQGHNPASLEEFLKFAGPHFAELKGCQGEGLAFLSERTTSPSLLAQRERLLKNVFPKATWHVWEPVNDDAALEGAQTAFGQRVRPLYDFSKADIVVSLDCDFLSSGPRHLSDARAFAARRAPAPGAAMNRLYAIEGVFSVTGAAADHRLALPASHIRDFALALAMMLQAGPEETIAHPFDVRWMDALAEDIRKHAGRVAVLAGERQSAEVHALAAVMSATMGRECVRWVPAEEEGALDSLTRLTEAMHREQVMTLVMLGGNPVYNTPGELMFREGLKRVGTAIQLSLYPNETTPLCQWHLPLAHSLESWGDTQSLDGTISLTQPLIAPLYGGLTAAELLATLAGEPTRRGYDLLHAHYQAMLPAENFESTWRKALHDGILIKGEAGAAVSIKADDRLLSRAGALESLPGLGEFELVLLPHPYLHDGRYANNGWLQETPEPITKLSWDNAALISVRAAQHLNLNNEDVIRIETSEDHTAELPVWIVPGMDDCTVAVHLGYGRTAAGQVGNRRGVDVYPLRTTKSLYGARGVKLTPIGRRQALATMQNHGAMAGRDLVREMTLQEIQQPAHTAHPGEGHAASAEHHEGAEQSQLWTPPLDPKADPQWAMAIDLSRCIGCHACVLACQAENNIPIVGKTQIAKGRIMQWLRVDRYYAGPPEKPDVVFQPMPCQQCETAPCEQVCPVAATTHSPEGLNDMAYNRCIGTRYCSNNCPYKVRRFNFFNYRKGMSETEKMAMNPDVTVRMRGVMEKCTYCVQRIVRARVEAKAEGRESLRDGEVLTACQQACPAQAIIFGNQADPKSRVAAAKRDARNYVLLEEFNFHPRTSYLARLSNPNPKLERSEG